jgi:transcriptional regulator EpsA
MSLHAAPPDRPAEAASDDEALLRALDAAREVRRKPQLFLWMQNHLRRFVPHEVALCAAMHPGAVGLTCHVFHAVPLPPELLAGLSEPSTPTVSALVARGTARLALGLDGPEAIPLSDLSGDPLAPALVRQGFTHLLMQGVASAREPHALDSLFVLLTRGAPPGAAQTRAMELLLPPLHLMTLRAGGHEVPAPAAARDRAAGLPDRARALTLRERQILAQVREGRRNAEVGEALGISALTVKNHLQKILRKLGAANRAQAVAEAMSRNLLTGLAPATRPSAAPAEPTPRGGPR